MITTLNEIYDNIDIFGGAIKKYNTFSKDTQIIVKQHNEIIDKEYYRSLAFKYNINQLITDDQLQTCLNILRWVYEHMLFRNYHEYDGELRADKIIDYSRKERVILNCAMHSIVLTELLLAANIECRSIQCLPFDPLDTDSHFINIAFIKRMNKWIALDPSHSTFFTNNQGVLLSLDELRTCYAEDYNYNINYHSRFLGVHFNEHWYRAYLSKNLFRFSRIWSYKFTKKNNTICFLEPVGYRLNSKSCIKNGNTEIYTTNWQCFWN